MDTLTSAEYAAYWNQAIPFQQYAANVEAEAATNPTEGNNKYVPINWRRMQRIAKTAQLSDAAWQLLSQLKEKIYWLVLTENWCGDSAQSTPIMEKMVEASKGKIEMRFIYRDAHLQLMNAHLTGASQSIPKVIQLDTNFHVIGSWGPRPDVAQQLVMRLKFHPDPAIAHTYTEQLHKWYAQDKQVGIEAGLVNLVKEAVTAQSADPQP